MKSATQGIKRTSRVKLLIRKLKAFNFLDSLRALELVMEVMSAKNGFMRHDGSDYFNHLVDVTLKLLNSGVRCEVTITSALLHDLPEDCSDIGYDMFFVEREYGKEVAKVVKLVTKTPGKKYLPEDIQEYLDAILEDIRACLVKTADRMHNFSTLGDATREKKKRQVVETEELYFPFFKACRHEYPEFEEFFSEAKTIIKPYLQGLKHHINEVEKSEAENEMLKTENEMLKIEIEMLKVQLNANKREDVI